MNFDLIALWIGRVVLVAGGLALAGALVWFPTAVAWWLLEAAGNRSKRLYKLGQALIDYAAERGKGWWS